MVYAVGTYDVEPRLLCLSGCGEDTFRLVTIEAVGGSSYLTADGCAVDGVVNRVLSLRQCCQLVLIMADAYAEFPLPVFCHDGFARERDIEALVLHLTAVAPVALQA